VILLLRKLWLWWVARQTARAAAEAAAPVPDGGPRPTGHPFPKLFVASVKMILRDRRTVIWSAAVPVLFAVLFGIQDFSGTRHVTLTVVPTASTAFSQRVVRGLEHDKVFDVTTKVDLAQARKTLTDTDGPDLVLAVPGSSKQSLTTYFEPGNTNLDLALGSVQRFVDGMNLRLAGITSPQVKLTERSVQAKDTNYYDFLLPGLVAWSVFNLSVIGIAIAVTRFREQKILKRILATPLPPASFLLTQIASRLLLSVGQAALLLSVAVFGFGAHIHGDPFWLFVYVVLGNVVFLNIGFAIAGRAKNTDSAQAMAQLVALPMVFLSGVFFPTSGLPPALEHLVKLLPLTPLTEALRKISLDGDPFTATWPQFLLLGAWVLVSLALARASFSLDEPEERRLFALRAT
jgi:ABC-2 type transport system permease protein